MRWRDITNEHHGLKVSVSVKSTPERPYRGEGPFVGYIDCPKSNSVPILRCGDIVRSFAWYWEVTILSGELTE